MFKIGDRLKVQNTEELLQMRDWYPDLSITMNTICEVRDVTPGVYGGHVLYVVWPNGRRSRLVSERFRLADLTPLSLEDLV